MYKRLFSAGWKKSKDDQVEDTLYILFVILNIGVLISELEKSAHAARGVFGHFFLDCGHFIEETTHFCSDFVLIVRRKNYHWRSYWGLMVIYLHGEDFFLPEWGFMIEN